MNNRKNILLILLSVFGLILLYNYIIVPLLVSYNFSNMGMGMGMHRYAYYSTNNNMLFQLIVILGMFIAAILLIDFFKPVKNCKKCGYEIRDDRWSVCPRCGTPIKQRKG